MSNTDTKDSLSKRRFFIIVLVVALLAATSLNGCATDAPSNDRDSDDIVEKGDLYEPAAEYDDPFSGLWIGDNNATIKERMGVPGQSTGSVHMYAKIEFMNMSGTVTIRTIESMDAISSMEYIAEGGDEEYNSVVEYYTEKLGTPTSVKENETVWSDLEGSSYVRVEKDRLWVEIRIHA